MYRRVRGLKKYPGSGIETKYWDTSADRAAMPVPPASGVWAGLDVIQPSAVGGALAAACFNSPSQGTTAIQRDGRKITMESLQINGIVSCASQAGQTAADTVPVVKVWVVLDKMTMGGTATGINSENVYTNEGGGIIMGLAPLRNMAYTKRYRVLKELTVTVPPPPMAGEGAADVEQEGVHVPWNCYIPLKGLITEFNGNAGTAADIVDNGIFLLAACSNNSLAPALSFNARLRFRG